MNAKRFQRKTLLFALLAICGVALAGCGREEEAAANGAFNEWPAGLFAEEAPAGEIRPVDEIVANAVDGETVLFRGYVGGRRDPFVSGHAAMSVTDVHAPHCHETGDEGCSTPWDFCCVPDELLVGKSVSVQVSGDDGRPLPISLRSVDGLEPLKIVAIRGIVRRGSAEAPPIIDARSIFIEE